MPPTDPGQPLAGPGWRLLAADAPPLHVPGGHAAIAATPEELADLLFARPSPQVDLDAEVVVALIHDGNACTERLVALQLEREPSRIESRFEAPRGSCQDVAVPSRFLVAVDRAAVGRERVTAFGVPLHVHQPGDTALPAPAASLAADLERLLAASPWVAQAGEGPVVGSYATAGVPLARDGSAIPRAALAWGRAYVSGPEGVARVDHRTGARRALVRRRDGFPIGERFTVDRAGERVYHLVEAGAVDSVDVARGTATRVIDGARPYDRADPFLWSPAADRLVVVGCDATGCASDSLARGRASVRLPNELEPMAVGTRAILSRHVESGHAILSDGDGRSPRTSADGLIADLHAAHALPGDAFILSGYGPDGRYRLVREDGRGARVILDRPAAFGLDQRERLLSPDWLLVARWDAADALEADGERLLAIDLRDGTLVPRAGAVALCPPTEVPCPPE